jgi:UDP-N-acetylmuramate dehydrogenase
MNVQTNIPLSTLCTIGTGGAAQRLVRVEDEGTLQALLERAPEVTVLGGCSNVLVADAGLPGVVALMRIQGISRVVSGSEARYTVGAGVDWSTFVDLTIDEGCAGLETLSGIPGTVGATPIQNVGAYGREVGEFLVSIRAYDRKEGSFVALPRDALGLAYRASILKHRSRYILTSVTFSLPLSRDALPLRYAELQKAAGSPKLSPREVAALVHQLRATKGMSVNAADPESRSVGSFFTNPIVSAERAETLDGRIPRFPEAGGRVKLAAGWLVENAGCRKGLSLGTDARVSKKHALALVNGGAARTEDVLSLARHIRARVEETFGVRLEPEPVMLGCAL